MYVPLPALAPDIALVSGGRNGVNLSLVDRKFFRMKLVTLVRILVYVYSFDIRVYDVFYVVGYS
jgi:hypothetical protein